jgi:isopentenyldiphosphate isomerase
MAEMLCEIETGNPPVFEIRNESETPFLTLSSEVGTSADDRTNAVASVMDHLREDGIVTGWRDELYPVAESFSSPPVFLMERAAVTVLGVLEYGVHINGLLQESRTESPRMWVARRAKTKSQFPGMLDHIVAGGQPAGLSLMENCIKECEEEAGIPESIARAGVHAVGAISYETWNSLSDKVTRCVLFNYDLYLPPDFEPKPVDGEVEGFCLWNMDQVKESIAKDYDDPIKPNCYVVIIDYLLRTGQVSPEAPGYLDVLRELRSGDCK